jgi:hypothetical protein
MMNRHDQTSSMEFHRRRAELEMDKALKAGKPSVAMLHLELARMHRQKRDEAGSEQRRVLQLDNPPPIYRTDKEA